MPEIVTTKRTVVLRRVPPGDRWSPIDDPNTVLDSLTEGLEHVFQATQHREYHLSPLDGFVYRVEETDAAPLEEKPKEPQKFNIYGDY